MEANRPEAFNSSSHLEEFEETEKSWVLNEKPYKRLPELGMLQTRRLNRHARHKMVNDNFFSRSIDVSGISNIDSVTRRDFSLTGRSPINKLQASRERRKKSPMLNSKASEMLNLTDSKIKDLEATWDSIKKTKSHSVAPDLEKSPEFKNYQESPKFMERKWEEEEKPRVFPFRTLSEVRNKPKELNDAKNQQQSYQMFEIEETFRGKNSKKTKIPSKISQGTNHEATSQTLWKNEKPNLKSPNGFSLTKSSQWIKSGISSSQNTSKKERGSLEKNKICPVDYFQPKPLAKTEENYKLDILMRNPSGRKDQNNTNKGAKERQVWRLDQKSVKESKEKPPSISPIRLQKQIMGRVTPTNQSKFGLKSKTPNVKEPLKTSTNSRLAILEKKQQQVKAFKEIIDKLQKDIEVHKWEIESKEKETVATASKGSNCEKKGYFSVKKQEQEPEKRESVLSHPSGHHNKLNQEKIESNSKKLKDLRKINEFGGNPQEYRREFENNSANPQGLSHQTIKTFEINKKNKSFEEEDQSQGSLKGRGQKTEGSLCNASERSSHKEPSSKNTSHRREESQNSSHAFEKEEETENKFKERKSQGVSATREKESRYGQILKNFQKTRLKVAQSKTREETHQKEAREKNKSPGTLTRSNEEKILNGNQTKAKVKTGSKITSNLSPEKQATASSLMKKQPQWGVFAKPSPAPWLINK